MQKIVKKITENELAEAVRFELTKGCPLPVFKTGAIDHSATLPSKGGSIPNPFLDAISNFQFSMPKLPLSALALTMDFLQQRLGIKRGLEGFR